MKIFMLSALAICYNDSAPERFYDCVLLAIFGTLKTWELLSFELRNLSGIINTIK